MRKVAILLLCIFNFIFLYSAEYSFEQISVKDGLSNATVVGIIQDKNGFLWFATRNGLNRYNGKNFKVYQNIEGEKESLPENYLNKLFYDKNDIIWICSQNGLIKFDIKTEKFLFYTNHDKNKEISSGICDSCYRDSKGRIWVGNEKNGIQYFDENKNIFENVKIGKVEDKNGVLVSAIIESREKELFLCTNYGLKKYNEDKKLFEEFVTKDGQKIDKRITNCFYGQNGNIWFTLENGTLIEYKIIEKEFKNYNINRYIDSKEEIPLRMGVEDEKGIIWLGTWGKGIILFNPITEKAEIIKGENRENGIKSNLFTAITKDEKGIIWLGSDGQGVFKFDYNKHKFEKYINNPFDSSSIPFGKITSIAEDIYGNIWISLYDNGIAIKDKKTGRFKHIVVGSDNKIKINNNRIFYLLRDSYGLMWIGTYGGGINVYDPRNEKMRYFNSEPNNSEAFGDRDNIAFRIFEDKDSNIWVGSYFSGVFKFNRKTEKFQHFNSIENDNKTLSNPTINTIFQDKYKDIWIGTDSGLNRIKNGSNVVERIEKEEKEGSISHETITAINEDIEGNLWVGTVLGLNRYNRKTEKFEKFGKKEGFIDETITSILSDNYNNFWIGTMKGLVKFDIKLMKAEVFTEDDGLQNNQFYWGSCFKDSDGNFYFGGITGLNRFKPEEIKRNNIKPKLAISSIKIFNNEVIGAEFLKEITLNHNQNYFEIEFAAMDFSKPEKNRYAYKIEELNSGWVMLGEKNYVTFSNFKHGNYKIRIKGSNNDGIWNEEGITLKLKVKNPFWLEWYAYITYFLIILFIMWIIMRYNLKLRIKEQVESKLRYEKECAENASIAKSQFLANMSHEIRTPMNGIIGITNMLMKTKLNLKQEEYVEMIKTSSDLLLNIINNILDISKIESGKMELEKNRFNLNSTLNFIVKSFEAAAHNKNIIFLANIDNRIPNTVIGDKIKLEQILINLLNNAVKFCEKGAIIFTTKEMIKTKESIKIEFEIKDSGIGIPKEKIEKIFDPYTQVDSSVTRKYGGTGLGLNIVKGICDLMQAEIEVESEFGKGTTFRVTMDFLLAEDNEEFTEIKNKSIKMPKLNILVAEDNRINQEYIKLFLEHYNQNVDVVSDGKEVIKIFEKKEYDLIFMDENMPFMNGSEAAKIIREKEKISGKKVIIAALTASAVKGEGESILSSGMDYYFTKPIEEEKILNFLCSIKKDSIEYINLNLSENNKEEIPVLEKEMLYNNFRVVEKEKFIKIIKTFLENIPDRMRRINECIYEKDSIKLAYELHSFKGVVSIFSAKEALGIIDNFEKAVNKRDNDSFELIYNKLEKAIDKLKIEIEKIILEDKK